MTCKQCHWVKIDEQRLIGWWDSTIGKIILFQCKVCGKLQKITLNGNNH